MRRARVWLYLPALLAFLAPSAAQAQVFSEPVNPFPQTPAGAPRRVERWQVAAYMAQWDFPLSPSIQAPVEARADPGALVAADYLVTPRLSLGGYWNHVTGEFRFTSPPDPELRGKKIADLAATYWDIHVTYYASRSTARSLSAQLGYTAFDFDIRYDPSNTQHGQLRSVGIWVNGSQSVGSRSFGGRRQPITLFGSAGYYPSDLGAANLIIGGSLPLSRRLSLSASVWLNDLTGDLKVRTTAGLSASF